MPDHNARHKVVFKRSDNGETWQTAIETSSPEYARKVVLESYPVAEIISVRPSTGFCSTGQIPSEQLAKLFRMGKDIYDKDGLKGCSMYAGFGCVLPLVLLVTCGYFVGEKDTDESSGITPENSGAVAVETKDPKPDADAGKDSNLPGQAEPLTLMEKAQSGDPDAQRSLGYMYYDGEGVEQDEITAYAWFNLAVANGDGDAKELRDAITPGMTPEQIAKGEELSKEMLKKNPKLVK